MQPSNRYLPLRLRASLVYGASILVVIGTWVARAITDPILRPAISLAAFGFICALIIFLVDLARGPRTKEHECVFFIAQTLCAALTILAAHRFYFDADIPIMYPYLGLKILALCLALATPARSAPAWTCFAILAFGPLVQSLAWMIIDQGHFDFFESFFNMGFVGFTILLWKSRLRLQQAFSRLLWLESRAKAAESLARLLLSARHLQNSALQVIESRTSLIEFDFPDSKRHTEEIQKAINQIVRLSSALEVCDAQADWTDFVPPKDHREFELRLSDYHIGKHARIPEL